jgi:hypothetical protein
MLKDGERYRFYDTARAKADEPGEHIHLWIDQGPDPSGGALKTQFGAAGEHLCSLKQDGRDRGWG